MKSENRWPSRKGAAELGHEQERGPGPSLGPGPHRDARPKPEVERVTACLDCPSARRHSASANRTSCAPTGRWRTKFPHSSHRQRGRSTLRRRGCGQPLSAARSDQLRINAIEEPGCRAETLLGTWTCDRSEARPDDGRLTTVAVTSGTTDRRRRAPERLGCTPIAARERRPVRPVFRAAAFVLAATLSRVLPGRFPLERVHGQ